MVCGLSVRGWLTRNASKVIETTVEQSKQTFANNVGTKTDLYYKLGRIGLLVVLAWLTGKEAGGYLQQDSAIQKPSSAPTHVTVNNYIYGDRERSNTK